jgi:hypothetical protein
MWMQTTLSGFSERSRQTNLLITPPSHHRPWTKVLMHSSHSQLCMQQSQTCLAVSDGQALISLLSFTVRCLIKGKNQLFKHEITSPPALSYGIWCVYPEASVCRLLLPSLWVGTMHGGVYFPFIDVHILLGCKKCHIRVHSRLLYTCRKYRCWPASSMPHRWLANHVWEKRRAGQDDRRRQLAITYNAEKTVMRERRLTLSRQTQYDVLLKRSTRSPVRLTSHSTFWLGSDLPK